MPPKNVEHFFLKVKITDPVSDEFDQKLFEKYIRAIWKPDQNNKLGVEILMHGTNLETKNYKIAYICLNSWNDGIPIALHSPFSSIRMNFTCCGYDIVDLQRDDCYKFLLMASNNGFAANTQEGTNFIQRLSNDINKIYPLIPKPTEYTHTKIFGQQAMMKDFIGNLERGLMKSFRAYKTKVGFEH